MSALWELANDYKRSVALFALSEAGVLRALAERPQTARELADGGALDAQVLEPLLELMVVAQVLARDGEHFVLDAAGGKVLPLVELEATMCKSRIRPAALAAALRGQPLGDPMARPAAAALWPLYRRAMACGAQGLGPHLVRFGPIPAHSRVVDLGGADGALAFHIARMVPGLVITVIDRPVNAAAFDARLAEVCEGNGLASARFCAGDLQQPADFTATLAEASVIIASNVMHLLTPAQRDTLVSTIHGHAPPECTLLIYDQFVSRTRADAASGMIVDWLLCGYRFDCTEDEFAGELRGRYAAVHYKRVAGVPGALVKASAAIR